MCRLVRHLAIALLTFIIGIAASGVFNIFRRPAPQAPPTVRGVLIAGDSLRKDVPLGDCERRNNGQLVTREIDMSINGGVLNGKATSLPHPVYPQIAREAQVSGPVSVQVTINECGAVMSARALDVHPLLQSAAVQAAYGARFSPTYLSGQPVKVSGVVTYNFVLPD